MTNEDQQNKTATELEWPTLLARIAEHCQSAAAAQRLGRLRPETSYEAATARMRRTKEALALCAEAPLPTGRLEPQEQLIETAERGALLDTSQLQALCLTLEVAQRLRRYLRKYASIAPLLSHYLATSDSLEGLLERLQVCIGPDGEILDESSSELKRARRRTGEIRQQLRGRLMRISEQLGEAMQGQYIAERDGRYVLPVRADAPFRVEGMVLGSSASGNTLYLEPKGTHELGNEVQRAEAVARTEEARILQELSTAVRDQLEEVQRAQHACLEADALHAIVRYAIKIDAQAFEPRRESELNLLGMRHPLLIGATQIVVANDLSLRAGQGLVISGPNAGGKTVALKSLGLAAWMARSGLPIPAQVGSTVGWFDQVCTDIGDNQSLVHSLSTFSAHLQNVGRCLSLGGPQTLVLIDELCGGTDPEEGAALAQSVLETLLSEGCGVCITTHYERLKTAAANDDRMFNAAVGFNAEQMLPTFRVDYGAPGASSALLVARRYAIADGILERAEALIPQGLLHTRALTEDLEQERARLQSAVSAAEEETRQVKLLRFELEQQLRTARKEERARLAAETDRVLAEVRVAREHLQQADAQLKTGLSTAAQQSEAKSVINQAAQFVAIGGKLRKAASDLSPRAPARPKALSWEELTIGTSVVLKTLGATGKVVAKPKRGQVTVTVGSMRTTVSLESLAPAAPSNPGPAAKKAGRTKSAPTKPRRVKASVNAHTGGEDPLRTESNTCNLIGQRIEEGLDRLDGFIDQLLMTGENIGFVLHGHGTGALKSAVRQHLKGHRAVSRAQPAERDDGGDALTLFWTA